MMYPRLSLLRQFLREDGAIFVSIDDNEVHLLRSLMDEIFGRQNFIAEMVWESAFKNDARQIGVNHEYVLVYGRNRDALPREWKVRKEATEPVLKEVARLKKLHGQDYEVASKALAGWFRANKAEPVFAHRRFRNIDARGAYKEDDPTAPGGRRIELKNPLTGTLIPLRSNRGWAFDQATFDRLVSEGRITFVTPTSVMVRRYLHETDFVTPQSVFYQPTRAASERLEGLLGKGTFDFPKDEDVLLKLIEMATNPGDLVLDSFAGSGTTAHAVLKLNKALSTNPRRFILVEMEPNIAHGVTRERTRLVAEGYTNAKGEPVPGLGGSFRFCDLGEPLFDEGGKIREMIRFADLARHVYFTETGEPLPRERVTKSAFIGECRGVGIYLLYNGILGDKSANGGNVLTRAVLAQLPPFAGQKVIYCAGCLLGKDRLQAERILIRQTPYEIKVS